MNRLKTRTRHALVAALALSAFATAAAFAQKQLAAHATARPEVKVILTGTVARGSEQIALDKAGAVHPGEVLDWKITSSNEGDGAAREYKTTAPVPAGTTFVAGSASAQYGAQVSYSIDGGKTFSPQPTVEEKQPDGTIKRTPAPASMYTEVRYEWAEPLAAGSKLEAAYKVRVK